jgi:Ran-binding protein 1
MAEAEAPKDVSDPTPAVTTPFGGPAVTPFGGPAVTPFGGPAPAASTGDADGDDDNALAVEEEAQVEFQPLVKLDEVQVKTGEDDEEVLFKMRAKLFRWESDSWEKEVKLWKERGTGDLKVLKHKETGQVRMLMRREKTMKICANFFLVDTIELKENAGSDRSWVWQCNDFSEEKVEVSVLAIRFANSENATKFKEEFDAGKKLHAAATGGASKGTPAKEQKKEDTAEKKDTPKKEAEDKKADEAAAAIEAVKIDGEKKD